MKLKHRIRNLFHPHEHQVFKKHNSWAAKMPKDIREAHTHCTQHREEILNSDICGCFYCLQIYKPSSIKEWADNNTCAICPRCGIDAVLGDKSGYPINHDFLEEMHKYWFEHTERI